MDGILKGLLKSNLSNYDELLKRGNNFMFGGIESKGLSRNDLLVLIMWQQDYYNNWLEEKKRQIKVIENLRKKK